VEITVFAAASLTEALQEIVANYKAAAPEVTVIMNLDSSGTLQTQIESGAVCDVFISAAQKQMDALESGQYIDTATRRDLLENKVVLIVPQGAAAGPASFEDVAGEPVSLVALGNADVPVGQYAEEIFTSLGVWDAVQAKASFGGNVKEVLSQVAGGSVDCGVVYATDAASEPGVAVVTTAPEGSCQPVVYPAAVLADAPNRAAALAFLAYLSEAESAAVFEKIGFKMA
jgi:molybdate transport system substrate-binding protein